MSGKSFDRVWQKGRIKVTARPHSACPRCYRDNEPVPRPGAHLLVFVCVCGLTWQLPGVDARRHGDWLSRQHHARQIGEK